VEALKHLIHALLASIRDLTPIILVIAFFQLLVLQQPIPDLGNILLGTLLVVVGLSMFVRGLEMGLFPIGETMAYSFAATVSAMTWPAAATSAPPWPNRP